MKKIVLLSPFLAGEELLCWVLARMTGLTASYPDIQKLATGGADGNWLAEGQFIVGRLTPVNSVGEWLSAEGVKPIFLVRNLYDLLIDQYRYFSQESSKVDHPIFAELTAKEGLSFLIAGGRGTSAGFSYHGLGIWSRQMQEMLRFSTCHPCCVMSYEKLLQAPVGEIKRLADFLGVDLTAGLLDGLMCGLAREIDAKTGGSRAARKFQYGLSREFTGMLAHFHSYMIRNMLTVQAPDLGALGAKTFFPEVTAKPPHLDRLERIFVSTVFKSGTKLLEHIVAKLTGLAVDTPDMSVGSDYESADQIDFKNGKFFIWHNVPSGAVKARIRAEDVRPIFLIRNIYDLVVSQYFHFANDVDAEIGHSSGTIDYFAEMGRDEGISLVLCGATSEHFNWHGYGYYLRQIQEILKFSKEYPCHVISYDRLVLDKCREIERLAGFLDIETTPEILSELVGSSSLDAMRSDRIASVGSGKHFRKGLPGDHVNVLRPHHYHMINHLVLTYAPELGELCEQLGFGDVIAPLRAATETTESTESTNQASTSNP